MIHVPSYGDAGFIVMFFDDFIKEGSVARFLSKIHNL